MTVIPEKNLEDRVFNAIESCLDDNSEKDWNEAFIVDDIRRELTEAVMKEFKQKEYLNRYKCPECNHKWSEVWSCACDSECPSCGMKNIQVISYEELSNVEEERSEQVKETIVKTLSEGIKVVPAKETNSLRDKVKDAVADSLAGKYTTGPEHYEQAGEVLDAIFDALGISEADQDIEGAKVVIDRPFCVMCPKCEHGFMTDESIEGIPVRK